MIFLLSPAKTLSETVAPTVLKHATSPRAAADVSELLPTLKALGTGDLRSLMGISDDLAKCGIREPASSGAPRSRWPASSQCQPITAHA